MVGKRLPPDILEQAPSASNQVYDHNGSAVRYGRALDDIRMHCYITGSGPPLFLIHGTPKTNYYRYELVPLFSLHFTIVAPNLRGFRYTAKPPTAMGYDSRTQAADLAGLMSGLGYDTFYVHGEDRGAEYAYVLSAIYRDRVMKLSFGEMLLSGVSLDKWSYFTPSNVYAQYELRGVWQWHIPFLCIAHILEMLIQGKEAEFWTSWKATPGGLRGVLETYRADLVNRDINAVLRQKNPLTLPIMTIGVPEFFGHFVREEMLLVANNVGPSFIFEECGHSLALEAEVRLADALANFFVGGDGANSTAKL
ncbi:alpha/beta-hydrolase [Bimuria novae-zelandiae CBS 107.79]|uniref:Alpha/beta-hydrolase n=1 Tax=Bimuria novae-zelandiae CBS 107.79 TaxID=1447943 RepID=A0A6A5V974_9PLEO|nr:alpha/beta-hydrolase [Bimuria novae-zelandiae CBS 107.79]